jgi:hypothetical protein
MVMKGARTNANGEKVAGKTYGAAASPLSAVWFLWSMAQICVTVSVFKGFLWIIPYHSTSEVSRVCKYSLLLESIIVVIAHPLVAVPSYPFDSGCFIPNGCEAVRWDDVFDLFRSKIPLASVQGPAFAPPVNWHTPFGVLHDGPESVKLLPYWFGVSIPSFTETNWTCLPMRVPS